MHGAETLGSFRMPGASVMEFELGMTGNQQAHRLRVAARPVTGPGPPYPWRFHPGVTSLPTNPMTHPDLARTIRHLDVALRVSPWRGRHDIVVIGPIPGIQPSPAQIHSTIEQLCAAGVNEVYTTALGPPEQQPFNAAGFTHREHLHLLRHDLRQLPQPRPEADHRLRRGWRRDYADVLDVDAMAFDGFWQFDLRALVEARNATPISRLRVADSPAPSRVVGYAVTGRSSRTCYLQRLAVHPDHQGVGTGTALVCDALRWARTRRADDVLVNTQEANIAAFGLYLNLGFHNQANGLDVLHWEHR